MFLLNIVKMENEMILSNKTAVITGCNRGIGKAILTRYAENGANIFAVIRKPNNEFTIFCKALEKKYNVEIIIVYAEFSDEDSVKMAAKEITATKKSIDIIVNNIGISNSGSSLAMTKIEDMKNIFQVNFFTTMLFTQLLMRKLIKDKKGSIIFIASTAVYDAWSNIEYTASKAAIVGAVRRLALELGSYGIRVNSIAPGLIETDMSQEMSEEDTSIIVNRNIMHRKGEPEEIADVAVFLGSEMSRYMTGQVLRVDGGLL